VTRGVSRTAQKFGLTNQAVKQIIFDAAVFASLPENAKADIAIDGHQLHRLSRQVATWKLSRERCRCWQSQRPVASPWT